MTSRPVLIAFSILTGLDVLLAGAALAEVVDVKWIGVATLGQAAVSAGLGFYVRGQVAPWVTVAAQAQPDGRVLAGPAEQRRTNGLTQEGDVVDVLRPAPIPPAY